MMLCPVYSSKTILAIIAVHLLITVRGKILEGQNIGECMLTNLLAVLNWWNTACINIVSVALILLIHTPLKRDGCTCIRFPCSA